MPTSSFNQPYPTTLSPTHHKLVARVHTKCWPQVVTNTAPWAFAGYARAADTWTVPQLSTPRAPQSSGTSPTCCGYTTTAVCTAMAAYSTTSCAVVFAPLQCHTKSTTAHRITRCVHHDQCRTLAQIPNDPPPNSSAFIWYNVGRAQRTCHPACTFAPLPSVYHPASFSVSTILQSSNPAVP